MFIFNFQNIFRLFKAQWFCIQPKNKKFNDSIIYRPIELYYPKFSFNKLNKSPNFKKNTFSEHIIYFDINKSFEDSYIWSSLVYEIYIKTNSKLANIKIANINNPYVKKTISCFNIEEEVETYDPIIKTCFKNSVELLGGKVYDPKKY